MEFNESFWVSFSTILLFSIVFRHVKNFMNKFFANRHKSIELKIEEAKMLQEKSEKLLKEYQIIYQEVDKTVQELLSSAEAEVEYIKKKAKNELLKQISQKRENAIKQIAYNEFTLIQKMKKNSVRLALEATLVLLHKHDFKKINANFINNSLENLSMN